jgi:SAM-dependent methyltransferase
MDYPVHVHYALLYARYLAPKRTEQLLDLCGDLTDAHVLDLCGGGGRASLEALRRGASHVVVVDESVPMSQHLRHTPGLRLVHESVEEALESPLATQPFNAVICQQAVNYWFAPALLAQLHRQMAPGSVFVFNTFWREPAAYPVPKEYVHEGRRYLELSWRTESNMIEHVQVCEGLPPHTTRFMWVTPEQFHQTLQPYFTVQEYRDEATSVYQCTAR